ncbi:MAG: TIGR03086 family metal-binding protein [Candidatus Dormibacteria bacterium]
MHIDSAGPVGGLRDALAGTERLIAAIGADDWSKPTPCPEWDVRALVRHLVAGNLAFASIVSGRAPSQGESHFPEGAPVDAYRESAGALTRAFGRAGALERMVSVPFGTVPGAVALQLRITEVLVHGWDVAEAIGATPVFADDLVEATLAFARPWLERIPAGRRPFAPPRAVPAGAPALDRLAATLGREVSGSPRAVT